MSALSQLKALRSEVQATRKEVKSLGEEWGTTAATMASRVEQAKATVAAAESDMDQLLARLREKGDGVVEEMIRMAEQFADGPWKEALLQALKALTDGQAEMQEVRRVFGQVEFIVDGLNVKASQLLAKMAPTQYQHKAQAIRQAFEEGVLGVEETIDLLDQAVNAWGQKIADLFRAFERGDATIQDVIREAERAKDALGPESQTGALAEGLEDLLNRAREDFQ